MDAMSAHQPAFTGLDLLDEGRMVDVLISLLQHRSLAPCSGP
jgi:hypothetical protein